MWLFFVPYQQVDFPSFPFAPIRPVRASLSMKALYSFSLFLSGSSRSPKSYVWRCLDVHYFHPLPHSHNFLLPHQEFWPFSLELTTFKATSLLIPQHGSEQNLTRDLEVTSFILDWSYLHFALPLAFLKAK